MKLRTRVEEIVNGQESLASHVFDWLILGLILCSIILLTVDTFPDLTAEQHRWLYIGEIVLTVLFTLEYLLRCWVSSPLHSYVFSWFGLVDLVAILPFYLMLGFGSAGLGFQAARSFRLLTALRLLKIGRYSRTMVRFHRAFQIAREELLIYLIFTGILLYLSATGIYFFEHLQQPDKFGSIFQSFWWAIVTLTTVGYGDAVPVTIGGQIFTFFILIIGLSVVAVPSGLVAAALTQARREQEAEHERLRRPSGRPDSSGN